MIYYTIINTPVGKILAVKKFSATNKQGLLYKLSFLKNKKFIPDPLWEENRDKFLDFVCKNIE